MLFRSLVCVDLKTGVRKWHYQVVHHPIWDYDLSSAPLLADITVNGKAIKAVALPSKESFLYVFDRITGQPVWPIEERPVPQSDVPGEKTSPTQPFPTKPPAYGRQAITVDELINYTPEMRAEALEKVKMYRMGPMFLPPVVSKVGGPLQSITIGTLGGGNHFIVLCLDESQRVWVMLHSGSRGIGNVIGRYFIEAARKDMTRHQVNLPHRDLAYFSEGSDLFEIGRAHV